MCRILAYLGEPLPCSICCSTPTTASSRQSYSPRMMNTFLNLAGFGMKAWDPASLRPEEPFSYRATTLPSFDRNLRCSRPSSRRPAWSPTSAGSPTPTRRWWPTRICTRSSSPAPALCSRTTGTCAQFARMRYALVEHVRPGAGAADRGHDRLGVDLRAGAVAARRSLRRARDRASSPTRPPLRSASCARCAHAAGIDTSSPVNLCVSTGRSRGRHPLLVRLRLVSARGRDARDRPAVRQPVVRHRRRVRRRDGGWQMTAGDPPRSVIIASEPLTVEHASWLEVPEYSMLTAELTTAGARVRDSRPRCLTPPPSTSWPRFRCSRAGRGGPGRAGAGDSPPHREAGRALWRQGERGRARWRSSSTERSPRRCTCPAIATSRSRRAGPGDMVGEIALLDGGRHTMSVRAAEATTLLVLGRADFAALLAPQVPPSFRLQAPAGGAADRALSQPAAASGGVLAGTRPSRRRCRAAFAELEHCGPPDSRYVRRMATFHDFDSLALWGFLTSGQYAMCPPGRRCWPRARPRTACYLTVNGAVEKVLARGDRRIRVGLAGPGKAFGYESLIDGGPSPVTAITRERALLLVLPRDRLRAAVQRRGRRLPRVPRRDPARPGGRAAPDAAPAGPAAASV